VASAEHELGFAVRCPCVAMSRLMYPACGRVDGKTEPEPACGDLSSRPLGAFARSVAVEDREQEDGNARAR